MIRIQCMGEHIAGHHDERTVLARVQVSLGMVSSGIITMGFVGS